MRPFVLVRDAFVLAVIALLILAGKGYISWWWLAVLCGVYFLILILGAFFIRWNFFIPSLHHGPREGMQIALTFDDGPEKHTEDILDVLAAEHVLAAFFCIGQRVEQSPEVIKRLHEDGHLIGNHSYAHGFHFDWQGRDKMVAEIGRTNEAVKAITGNAPRYFRPPYGVTNPELSHAVTLSGMYAIGWSLRSFDTKAKTADSLLGKLLARARGGDVILLHDSEPLTAAILTGFIRSCREKGFTFVRLDEMLGLDAYA